MGEINQKSIIKFYKDKGFGIKSKEMEKLWNMVGIQRNCNLVSENQFYAITHIARLHKNKHKKQCNLNHLQSLPHSLRSAAIKKLRIEINDISLDAKSKNDAMENGAYNMSKEIDLNTKIGTMLQLKNIAKVNHKKPEHIKQE